MFAVIAAPLLAVSRPIGAPPLKGVGRRVYIGGVVPNTPKNLIRWIRDPQTIDPLTAMPITGGTDAPARDIAAYL